MLDGALNQFSLTVNNRLLTLGSSSGSIYVFDRKENGFQYSYCVPNYEGKITSISLVTSGKTRRKRILKTNLSSLRQADHEDLDVCDEVSKNSDDLLEHHDIVAVGTCRGSVKIVLLHSSNEDIDLSGGKVLYCAKNFTSSSIKFLRWNSDDTLWICDENAAIYMLNRIQSLSTFLIPHNPVLVIKLDSIITAIDSYGNYLAISTLNRSLIYSAVETSVKQIGTKPRPSGNFGITFFRRGNRLTGRSSCCIYAARPRARLWQANLEGNVELTHQFKNQIFNSKASRIYKFDQFDSHEGDAKSERDHQSNCLPNFANLNCMTLGPKNSTRNFLIAQSPSPDGYLFIIDPVTANIVTWTANMKPWNDVHVVGSDIYLSNMGDESVTLNTLVISRISVVTPFDYLNELVEKGIIDQAIDFLMKEKPYFKRLVYRDFAARNLVEELKEKIEDQETGDKISLDEFLVVDNDSDIEVPLTFYRSIKINLNGFSFQPNNYVKTFEEDSVTTTNTDELKSDENSMNHVVVEDALSLHQRKISTFLENLKLDLEHLLSAKCKCGHPKPGSHLEQKSFDELKTSLEYLISESSSLETYLDLAFEVGYWPIYCKILLELEKFDDFLSTCLALNDLTLLEEQKFLGYLKKSPDKWKTVISNFSSKLQPQMSTCCCLSCGFEHQTPSLQWSNLFRFMSSNLTPSETIIALKENLDYLPEGAVNPQFCLSLIKSHVIYNYQSKKKEKP